MSVLSSRLFAWQWEQRQMAVQQSCLLKMLLRRMLLGRTILVPLNKTALAVLEKYKDYEGPKLLPFITQPKYNDAMTNTVNLLDL